MVTKEKHDPELLEIIENYRPIDDEFMRKLFRGNLALAQEVIRIVTGIEDLVLLEEHTQYDINSIDGSRAVCLDVYGVGEGERRFDIEIQRQMSDMPPERPRYHISAMDVEFLKAGGKFSSLPTTYVIIFCETDPFGLGQLTYVFDRRDRESNLPLNDRTIIIYVNCAYNNPNDRSDKAKLARDFLCKDPDKMQTKLLAEAVRSVKQTTEGVSDMCNTFEEYVKRKEEIAEARTKKSTSMEIAASLLAFGMTEEKIALATKLSVEEVRKLAASINAPAK